MSQTFSTPLLLISLLLESAALSSGRAASRFQFHFGALLGRFRMVLGASPERVAAKDKVAGTTWSAEASPLNNKTLHIPQTNAQTNTQTRNRANVQSNQQQQTDKQTNKQTNSRRHADGTTPFSSPSW